MFFSRMLTHEDGVIKNSSWGNCDYTANTLLTAGDVKPWWRSVWIYSAIRARHPLPLLADYANGISASGRL